MKSNRLTKHSPKSVPSEWLTSCKTQEEKAKEIEYLRNCSTLFDKLKEMVQKRYDSTIASNDTDYDSASWSHKQAHRNGKLEAYEEIFKLLP